MKVCKRCQKRGKTWKGSDPICAFPDGATFSKDNWNCATMNDLRMNAIRCARWVDDNNYALLSNDEDVVFLRWYKRRGRIEVAVVVTDGTNNAPLSLEIAEALLGGE